MLCSSTPQSPLLLQCFLPILESTSTLVKTCCTAHGIDLAYSHLFSPRSIAATLTLVSLSVDLSLGVTSSVSEVPD